MRQENENKVVDFLKSKNAEFELSCLVAGIKPSRRQASKWLNKKGIAYKKRFGK